MAKYKESKDNPLHQEFGTWSNTRYILKKCREYCPSALVIAAIGIVCNSVMTYFWGILGKLVIDLVQGGTEQDTVRQLILIVVAGGLGAGILQLGSIYAGSKVWYRLIYIRMQLIRERVSRALGIPYESLEKPAVLDIHERASQATGGNDNGVEGMMRLLENMGTSLVTLSVTFVSVLVLDFRLVFVLIALGLIQFAYHIYCIRKDKKNVWDKLGNTWRQLNYMERVTQDFDYAKDIRLFHLKDFLLSKQQKLFEKRWEKFDYHQNLWYSHAVVSAILFMIGKACIYGVLFYAVLNKDMTVGNFTLYFALAVAFSSSLQEFLHRFGDYRRASLEVDDFRSFMELDLGDQADAIPIPNTEEYHIEFRNVSYRYPEAEKDALSHLNLRIASGEKLAVVGLNGAGKTTMIKLLLRLYDPTEGSILLNGVDIRTYRREEYYRLFSPIFQNVEMFAFPIAENISMRPSADTDVDRAYECAVEAGLQERIDSLEKGVLTELLKVVDDKGVDFSGGEKQKLALARALYKNAPIVVLDEPTSALDAIAEQRLYQRFDRMIGDKSAIYISHRLASTRFCDRVAMFKDGEMIEYGTHEALMEAQGEYARMFELQAQYYQEQKECGQEEMQ